MDFIYNLMGKAIISRLFFLNGNSYSLGNKYYNFIFFRSFCDESSYQKSSPEWKECQVRGITYFSSLRRISLFLVVSLLFFNKEKLSSCFSAILSF